MVEKGEEALDLVERDHLREEGHNPILAQDEHLDLLFIEVTCELRQLLLNKHFYDFTVEIKTGQFAHMNLLEVVVIQQPNRQLKCKHFTAVVE